MRPCLLVKRTTTYKSRRRQVTFIGARARCTICQDASSKLSLCKRCFGAAYCAKCVTTHPKDDCDASDPRAVLPRR